MKNVKEIEVKKFKHDIFYVENFLTDSECDGLAKYFDNEGQAWDFIAFYGASGKGLQDTSPILLNYGLPENFIQELRTTMLEHVEIVFERKLKANTSHAQKWGVGGFASPHSDNSDFDGVPNAFEINKYVTLLYLNDNFDGGEIYFPQHNIEIKPQKGMLLSFPGGHENIHGVREVTSGERHTMMAFWDYADSDYSQELKDKWEEEIKIVREQQEKQKEEWQSK
jgi:PKHD-type hydroxylase